MCVTAHIHINLLDLQQAQSLLAYVVTRSPQSCSSCTLLHHLYWLPVKHHIDFIIANITYRTLYFFQLAYLRSSLHACHSTRSLRLTNTNLLSAAFVCTSFGPAVSALQFLKFGTLSLHLSIPVPVLIPSVVTSGPTAACTPSSPLNPYFLAPQIQLLLTIVHVY